jgi:hypothetical protein
VKPFSLRECVLACVCVVVLCVSVCVCVGALCVVSVRLHSVNEVWQGSVRFGARKTTFSSQTKTNNSTINCNYR